MVLAGGLVLASVGLLGWHLRQWRSADTGSLDDRDYRFHRRQYLRRVATSGLLGIAGLLMLVDPWIEHPLAKVVYWTGIAAVVISTGILALADWLATRAHYEHMVREHVAEHAVLKAEIDRYRREQQQGPPEKGE